MIELAQALLATPVGTVLLFVIVIGLFGILFPVVMFLLKKLKDIKKGPAGIEFYQGNDGKEVTKVITSGDGKGILKIPENIYLQIVDSFNSSFKEYISDRLKLNGDTSGALRESLDQCVNAAIGNIVLNFTTIHMKNQDSNGDFKLLQLFLEAEFGKILRDELLKIQKDVKLPRWTDIESSEALMMIMKNLTRQMKIKVMTVAFLPFSQESLKDLAESMDTTIRETVWPTIQTFVRLSKEEQESLLDLDKKRQEKIEHQLKNVFEVV